MNLLKLQHGKALTQNNFPKFVETFNQMVDFINNLRGDGEWAHDVKNDNANLYIELENENGYDPVICLKGQVNGGALSADAQTLDVVTNVEWDSSNGSIKVSHQTIKFYGELSGEATQTTIGTDPWTAAPTPFPNVN